MGHGRRRDPRPRLGRLALVAAGTAILGACGDLFHSTTWNNRCDTSPEAPACGTGGQGGGGAAGTGGAQTSQVGSGGSVDPEQACALYAADYCAGFEKCLPLMWQLGWGDAAGCLEGAEHACKKSNFGPGSSFGPDALAACSKAQDFGGGDCSRFLRVLSGQVVPDACVATGSRADGDSCVDFRQCSGGACRLASGEACGTCASTQPQAGVCETTGDCQPNLTCASGVCVVPGDVGQPCTITPECYADLVCSGGLCAPRQPPRAACNPGIQDCVPEQVCVSTATCQPYGVAAIGETCGLTAGGGLILCAHGAACHVTDRTTGQGGCVPWRTEGQLCDFDGPISSHCAPPARCVLGVCYVKDALVCE